MRFDRTDDRIKFRNEPSSKKYEPFNVSATMTPGWEEYPKRILFVCEHVHPFDLKAGELLSAGTPSTVTLNNCIEEAGRIAKNYGAKLSHRDFGVAAINFNFFKTYTIEDMKKRKAADREAADRVIAFIAKYKPTDVVICGATATMTMLGTDALRYVGLKRRVKFKLGGEKVNVYPMPDFARATDGAATGSVESDDEKALAHVYNLGYFCQQLAAVLMGEQPWRIKNKIKARYVNVDSIEKFKRMMKKLYAAKVVAVDTEGTSLEAHTNKLLTFQFATKSKFSYIVTTGHKDSPFNAEELEYITKELRKFFMQKMDHTQDKYLLFCNAKYDLKVIRAGLEIPFIYWPVYDVMVGEHQLNENMVSLSMFAQSIYKGYKQQDSGIKENSKVLGLAQIALRYGVDFYYTHEFSKSQRVTIVSESLTKPVFEYASMDAQILFEIRDVQLIRAKHEIHYEGKKKVSFLKDFLRNTLFQMSNNLHCFASMEMAGFYTSKSRLRDLKKRGGRFDVIQRELIDKFYASPEVKEANKIIMEEAGISTTQNRLFDPFVFNWNKSSHIETLFVKVCGLQPPLSAKGFFSFGKEFKDMYKETHELVDIYAQISSIKQLRSSFLNTFSKKLDTPQGRKTSAVIPDFGFATIVSGRSNSSGPSLQNAPEHGPLAKAIKEIFVAKMGYFKLKMDYSAHEVRCWGITAHDKVLADVFAQGFNARKKLANTTSRKKSRMLAKMIKIVGDLHIVNGAFFFSVKPEDVTKEMRQGTKGVVFGAIYGRAAATLAKQLGKPVEFAEDLYNRFFKRFFAAAGWLTDAVKSARSYGFSNSVLGRRRRLPGFLTGLRDLVAAMERRAKNAPIQGMGADLGHTGARLFEKEMYEFGLWTGEFKKDSKEKCGFLEVMIHDSMFTQQRIAYIIPAMYIMAWSATTGVAKFYKENYGLKLISPLEIEIEVGVSNAESIQWNFQSDQAKFDQETFDTLGAMPLMPLIERVVDLYCKLYPTEKKKHVTKEVMRLWGQDKVRDHILKTYPLFEEVK